MHSYSGAGTQVPVLKYTGTQVHRYASASVLRSINRTRPPALTYATPLLPPGLLPKRSARAVVIGSGFGGLAAAVRLGARGYRVTVLEKLDAPGGRAYVYRQDGFTFDAGPTIVTAPFLFEDLWRLCGRRMADDVELRPVAPFYRIRFDDGHVFDYTGDALAMRAEVARLSPGDVAGYERFMRAARSLRLLGRRAAPRASGKLPVVPGAWH